LINHEDVLRLKISMRNTKTMQVVNSSCDLMSNLFGSILRDLEVLSLKVREEISSLEIFHDDVDVVRVLKHIIESNDIRMLADLEYLNFSLEKLDILKRQLFLLDDLDSDFLA
jgi:hypothetical protein